MSLLLGRTHPVAPLILANHDHVHDPSCEFRIMNDDIHA